MEPARRATRIATISAACAILLATLSTFAEAARRNDPLTAQERRQACTEALGSMDPAAQAGAACLPPRVARRADRRGWHLLLIERRAPAKDSTAAEPRYADVYFYNYRRNVLHQFVVDIGNGRLMGRERHRGVQLPLTEAEIMSAKDLVSADDTLRARISVDYQDIAGEPLASLEQLEIKAFAFHASTLGGHASGRLARCGTHRCAQLSLSTNGIALDVQPIVDLSRSLVFDLARARQLATQPDAAGHDAALDAAEAHTHGARHAGTLHGARHAK